MIPVKVKHGNSGWERGKRQTPLTALHCGVVYMVKGVIQTEIRVTNQNPQMETGESEKLPVVLCSYGVEISASK